MHQSIVDNGVVSIKCNCSTLSGVRPTADYWNGWPLTRWSWCLESTSRSCPPGTNTTALQ